MEDKEIEKKVFIIFEDEKEEPTVRYNKLTGTKGLVQGGTTPLIVENQQEYGLESKNMDLLLKLYLQLSKDAKAKNYFFKWILIPFKNTEYHPIASLSFQTLVRLNKLGEAINYLFASFENFKASRNLYGCFKTLEYSLRYESNLYTDFTLELVYKNVDKILSDYRAIPKEIAFEPLGERINRQDYITLLKTIQKQVNKIWYMRLEKELSGEEVGEINQDRIKVQQLLSHFKFSKDLQESLDKFEVEYRKAKDEFDFKNCIVHVRSFIDHLGKEIIEKIEPNVSIQFEGEIKEAVQVRDYLKDVGFITEKEHLVYRALFGLSSDEGVHPLKANKETARLCKNMVIEYGLILLQRVNSFK